MQYVINDQSYEVVGGDDDDTFVVLHDAAVIREDTRISIDGKGGIDTIDLGADISAQRFVVDLDSGKFYLWNNFGTQKYWTIANVETVIGGQGDDLLRGGALSETLDGGAGSDIYRIDSGGGHDIVIANSDTGVRDLLYTFSFYWDEAEITRSGEDVVLAWGADQITIRGVVDGRSMIFQDVWGRQHDVATGERIAHAVSDGNDVLAGTATPEDFDGLSGHDLVDYSESSAGVTVNLASGRGDGGYATGDSYQNIEGVLGSDFDDVLTLRDGTETASGGAGDDTIIFAGTTDGKPDIDNIVDGAAGYDVLNIINPAGSYFFLEYNMSGMDGAHFVPSPLRQPQWDLEWATTTRGHFWNFEEVNGGAGSDVVFGSSYGEIIRGGAGDDNLRGGAGDDVLQGDAGRNGLSGGAGNDEVTYDWFSGSIVFELLTNQHGKLVRSGVDAGQDTLSEIETLILGRGDDYFYGAKSGGLNEKYLNYIFGNDGNDTFELGNGTTRTVAGGRGADTYIYKGGTHVIDTSRDFDGRDTLIVNVPLSSVTIERTADSLSFIIQGGGRIDVIGPNAANGVQFLKTSDGKTIDLGPYVPERLEGTDGDDTLVPVPGGTIYDGLAGFDTVDYSASPAGVTVDLGSGVAHGGNAQGNRFVSIEAVIGSAFADRLAGSAGADHFTGGDGADQLYGREGNDVLIGGAGGDLLNGGAGVDVADYSGSSAGVTVDLAAGKGTGGDARDDVLTGIEQVIGSAYADVLTASSDPAGRLSGGGGNDRLFGSLSGGTVDGGGGTDAVEYGGMSEGVRIDLQAGRAELISDPSRVDILINVELAVGGAGNDLIIGSDGGGVLRGGGGDDALTGGAGNDVLYGDAGADSFTGGAGIDTVSYFTETAPAGVGVNLAAGIGYRGVATGDRYLDLIENVNGGAGNDTIMGNSAANRLYGYGGNDILGGGAGDELSGGRGNDSYVIERAWGTVTGEAAIRLVTATGDGNDTVVLDGRSIGEVRIARTGESYQIRAGTGVIEIAGSGGLEVVRWIVDQTGQRHDIGELIRTAGLDIYATTTGTTHLATELAEHFIGIGNATMSYAGATATVIADIGAGTAGGDALARGDSFSGVANLTGGSGADILYGDAGDNRLEGGAGNDVLVGGGGIDTFVGNAGYDTVSFAGWTTGLLIDLQAPGAQANGLILRSIENLIGGEAGDTLQAAAIGSRLEGRGGNDYLIGSGGNDVLIGGAGADRLSGGEGVDTVNYAASSGAVIVDLAAGLGASGDASGDVLTGVEQVIGSAFNDRLSGSDAEFERLEGGDGADMLVGRGGRDVLTGGAGADLFVYSGTADSLPDAVRDTITDFSRAEGDRIDLSRLDAIPDTAARDDFTFLGSSAFTGRAGELRVVTSGATSQVYADFDGDGIADFQIEVRTAGTGLVAADFLF